MAIARQSSSISNNSDIIRLVEQWKGVEMQVKDMTVEELKRLIRDQVEEVLEELLGDPDEGKEIKE